MGQSSLRGASEYPVRMRGEERLKHRQLDRENQPLDPSKSQDLGNSITKTSLPLGTVSRTLNPSSSDGNHLPLPLAWSGKTSTACKTQLVPALNICLTRALDNPKEKQGSLGCPL